VLRALEAPMRQIAENAGAEGSVVVGKLADSKDRNFRALTRRPRPMST
jgi:chaperonin GroEL